MAAFGGTLNPNCIQDGHICHWTGRVGRCCSGHCDQLMEQEFGTCRFSVATSSATAFSSGSSSSSSSSSTSFTLGPQLRCLEAGERCVVNGSIGVCCSTSCNQQKDEPYGYCVGSTHSPSVPPRCLPGGAECSILEPMGQCCSLYCHVLAPHKYGTCNYTKDELEAMEGQSGNDVPSWLIVTAVGVSVTALLLFALIWLYLRHRKLEKTISRKERNYFFYGNPEQTQLNGYAHENAHYYPYDKERWEVKGMEFSINWESILGAGCFGLVLKGKVKGKDVAVKTVRDQVDSGSHLRSLLSEIKVLQYIGHFENIVNMVGSNTARIDDGKVYLFLEFCPLGSLEKYLRENKSKFRDDSPDSNTYVNTLNLYNDVSITKSDLINWSLQITNAMRYLETRKVIHADLASRNVLLLNKDCVKLTDFGLSRRLYEYSSYVKRQQEPLPWRYMALESLQHLSFSHQSDVWSLGITFWEIFSFGDVPYPGLSWTMEFVTYLQNNLRPGKPSICPDELYDIMLDCWKPEPYTRPKFEEIYKRLWNYKETRSAKMKNRE